MLWRGFAAGRTGELHYIDYITTLCRNIEATPEDISQEVKAWTQVGLQMDNDPKHTTRLVTSGQQSQSSAVVITNT